MTPVQPPPDLAPLAGVRVVDLTHIVAGPVSTQYLADAGALIIKIEPPGGEYSRIRGPQRKGQDGTTLSSYSAAVNRGKHSIELDLKNPAGRTVFDRLVATADVLVENFAPTTLPRIGISFDELRRRHPRLITASVNLWGVDAQDELSRRGGLNVVAESETGLYDQRRDTDGSPLGFGFALADTAGGLAAYAAIVTALLERDQTGLGQHLPFSMARHMLSMNIVNVARAQRPGESEPEERFAFVKTGDGWVARDSANENASAPLASAPDILANDRYRALGYLREVEDGLGGSITVPANPLGFHFAIPHIPRVNENAASTLRMTLGIQGDELEALRAAGAFGSRAGSGAAE